MTKHRGSEVKSTGCFSTEPRFNSQHPHGTPQWSVAPVPGDDMFFWTPGTHMVYTHTCRQTPIPHKIKTLNKEIWQDLIKFFFILVFGNSDWWKVTVINYHAWLISFFCFVVSFFGYFEIRFLCVALSGSPETQFIDHAGLELRYTPASTSQVPG